MDRITRLFGVQLDGKRRMGRWLVPGLLMALLATALFAASCEPNLVQDPPEKTSTQDATGGQQIIELQPDPAHLEAAQQKLEMARANGDLTDEQYKAHLEQLHALNNGWEEARTLVVPLEDGSHLLLPEDVIEHFGDRTPTKHEIHEYLQQREMAALHEEAAAHGEGNVLWESVDGQKVTKEFFESSGMNARFGETPDATYQVLHEKVKPEGTPESASENKPEQ